MSVYTVAKKIASMNSYRITDESGADLYYAQHHAGLGKEHWDITDAQGTNVATLMHKAHIHATFDISGQGLTDSTLTKVNFMPVAETWTLDGSAGQATLKGDLADYQWSLTMPDGTLTATFARRLVSMHHQVSVTVNGDPRVAIAVAIALDVDHEDHK